MFKLKLYLTFTHWCLIGPDMKRWLRTEITLSTKKKKKKKAISGNTDSRLRIFKSSLGWALQVEIQYRDLVLLILGRIEKYLKQHSDCGPLPNTLFNTNEFSDAQFRQHGVQNTPWRPKKLISSNLFIWFESNLLCAVWSPWRPQCIKHMSDSLVIETIFSSQGRYTSTYNNSGGLTLRDTDHLYVNTITRSNVCAV